MENKVLNKMYLDGCTVKAIQTDKGIRLDIEGNEMEVFINGESFFAPYEEEEYKYIPANLRPFVKEFKADYNNFNNEIDHVGIELTIEGLDYYTKISKKRGKNNNIELVNDLEDYKLVQDYHDIEIPNAEENFKKLLVEIENIGYKLQFSHGGNETYNYYSLIVPMNKFDKIKILNCIKVWQKYNKELEKYLK